MMTKCAKVQCHGAVGKVNHAARRGASSHYTSLKVMKSPALPQRESHKRSAALSSDLLLIYSLRHLRVPTAMVGDTRGSFVPHTRVTVQLKFCVR